MLKAHKEDCKYKPVPCPNKCKNDKGEVMSIAIKDLDKHMEDCKYSLVPCPNKCKNDKGEVMSIPIEYLDKHVEEACPRRMCKCKFCEQSGIVFAEMEDHFKVCKKVIIPCTNDKCPSKIQRRGLKRHLAEVCPYTEVPCKYAKLGCGVRMSRNSIATHENDADKYHLHHALEAIVALEESKNTLRSGKMMVFKVTDYEKKKNNSDSFTSPSFYTPNGFRLTVTIYPNGTEGGKTSHVSACLNVLSKNGEEGKPFGGSLTITLLNQLADQNHHICEGSKVYEKLASHAILGHDQQRNVQYLKDNTLYFRVSVSIPNSKPWLEIT